MELGRAGRLSRRKCRDSSRETTSQRSLKRRSPPPQVESMRHVHLHVISTDFLSPKLKNKKCVTGAFALIP